MNALERFGSRLSSTAWQVPARYTAAVAFTRLRAVIADDRARCRGRWERLLVSVRGRIVRRNGGYEMPLRAVCRWSWGIDGRPEPNKPRPRAVEREAFERYKNAVGVGISARARWNAEMLNAGYADLQWPPALTDEHRALQREKNELAARFVSRLDSLTMPTRGNRRGIQHQSR